MTARMNETRSETGAALLTAIMIVALMSAAVISVLESIRFASRLSINLAAREQASLYVVGVEELVAASVRDIRADGRRDRFPELDAWLGSPIAFPIEGGAITGQVRDGSNCFNVNALVRREDKSYVRDDANRLRLVSLATDIGMPPDEAEAIAMALSDWADTDTRPGLAGAEDDHYLSLAQPFRTPNTLFTDISEIRLVRGMTPDAERRLAPFLCVRPQAALNRLNLNTLQPWQAPLLAAYLGEDFDTPVAARLLAERPRGGFDSVDSFISLSGIGEEAIADNERSLYDVNTQYLDVLGEVTLGPAAIGLHSLLVIEGSGAIKTLSRWYGTPE